MSIHYLGKEENMDIRIENLGDNILMFAVMCYRPNVLGFVMLMPDGNHTVTTWHEGLDDQTTTAYKPVDWPTVIDKAVFRLEHS